SLAKVEDRDSEIFDWSRKLARGVPSIFDDLRRSTNQIFNATAAQIFFEDSFWVIKISDDQIESGEVIGQFCRQFRFVREKSRERSVFDRAHRLRIKSILCKDRNVLVTEYFDVRTRPGVT